MEGKDGKDVGRPVFEAWAPPLLRWAGSKRKLLPRIFQFMPPSFERYIEPFVGSACLFFALKPARAVLGDYNKELMLMYRTIREHPRLVARTVLELGDPETNYYRIRSSDPEKLNHVDRAAHFIYLNRYSFNGVYRTNQQGRFNVPRGRNTGRMPSEATVYRCAVALRNAKLRAVDFAVCLSDARRGDFVYIDPPYSTSQRPTYGEYGYGSFSAKDLPRLFDCLRQLDRAGAVFLMSYSKSLGIIRDISRWSHRSFSIRRHVAGFSKFRLSVPEVMVSNRDIGGGD